MKRTNVAVIAVASAILLITAFKVSNAESGKTEASKAEEKSVAWFVANTRDARTQNDECHNNPGIQSTPNCVNALHALQISFAGGPGRR